MPFQSYPKYPIFRFLLHKSRWEILGFSQNEQKALDTAILDLNPEDDNISIYCADDSKKSESSYSDFEIIAFLFSASTREEPSHLYFIDLTVQDIRNLGLKIRKNSKSANLNFNFYAQRHFEIYPMDQKSRYAIASMIFDLIKNKYNGVIPKIDKNRFKSLKSKIFIDSRLSSFPKEKLRAKWQ